MSNLSSQHHSFDIALASRYGIEEAILIHHFQHWIRINQFAKRNIKDGHCWTYQSRTKIQEHFPYWNVDRVKYLCEKLVDMGVLITANYNKSHIDKTLWYAFVDEAAFQVDAEFSRKVYERQKCPSKGKSALREGKSAQPIPDTKTLYTETTDKEIKPPNPQKGEIVCVSFGSFVKLSRDELTALNQTYTEKAVKDMIDQINDYLASTGKKPYKDYAAAIRQWFRRRSTSQVNSFPEQNKNQPAVDEYEIMVKNRVYQQHIYKKHFELTKQHLLSFSSNFIEFSLRDGTFVKYYVTDAAFQQQVEAQLRKMGVAA